MSQGPSRRVRFGAFALDLCTDELWDGSTRLKVPDQSIQILEALLERPGELVTREDLRDRLWPSGTYVDYEHGLNAAVRRLREALGDSADAPRYVETLPRRGYRFIGVIHSTAAPSAGRGIAAGPQGTSGEMSPNPAALERDIASIPPDAASQSRTRERKRVTWPQAALSGALACGAAAVVTLAFSVARPGTSAGPDVRPVLTRLTFDDGLQTEPSFSPAGDFIAYSANTQGNFDIWTQPVAGGNGVQVTTHAAHDWQPDWSPDGGRIVFRSERDDGGLFVTPATGGHEQRLSGFGYRPRWSPDGSRVLFADSALLRSSLRGLYIVGVDGKPAQGVDLADLTPRETLGSFGWHGDGQRVAILGAEAPEYEARLTTVDVAVPTARRWTVNEPVQRAFQELQLSVRPMEPLAWDARRSVLYFAGVSRGAQNIWSIHVDPDTHTVTAGPHQLTMGQDTYSNVTVSRDGRRIGFDGGTRTSRIASYALDRAGRLSTEPAELLTPPATHAIAPDLVRDGSKLLFSLERPGSGRRRELVVRTLSGGTEETLQVDDLERGEWRGNPLRWSPDGTRIVYRFVPANSPIRHGGVPATGAAQQIRILNVRTKTEQELTSLTQMPDHPAGWSPDGKHVISTGRRYERDRSTIVLLPISAAPRAELAFTVVTSSSEHGLWQPTMSPNGRWIAFNAVPAGRRSRVMVVSSQGGDSTAWRPVSDDHTFWADKPRWSEDGRVLYFVSDRGGLLNVWGVDFDPEAGHAVGSPFRLTQFTGPGEGLLPNLSSLEIAVAGGRLTVPVVHPTGGISMLEHLNR